MELCNQQQHHTSSRVRKKGVVPNSPFNLAAYINHSDWRKIGALVAQWDLLNLHSLFLARARPTHLALACVYVSEIVIVMHTSQGVRVKSITLFFARIYTSALAS